MGDDGQTHYYGDDCDPPHIDPLEAARGILAEADRRDLAELASIDPDALGDVMARLAALARDLRQQGIATTIDVRIVIAVPADE